MKYSKGLGTRCKIKNSALLWPICAALSGTAFGQNIEGTTQYFSCFSVRTDPNGSGTSAARLEKECKG